MKIKKLTVTYTDEEGTEHTEDFRARRMPYTRRTSLLDKIRDGMQASLIDALKEVVQTGEPVRAMKGSDIKISNMADYQVTIITESVCDENGKLLFSRQVVDDWDDRKIFAYARELDVFQNARVEDAAKNSTTTTSDAAS